jgi:hypothetical protein
VASPSRARNSSLFGNTHSPSGVTSMVSRSTQASSQRSALHFAYQTVKAE